MTVAWEGWQGFCHTLWAPCSCYAATTSYNCPPTPQRSVAISHVGIAPSLPTCKLAFPNFQTKPMRSTCCQTLTHPKTVYRILSGRMKRWKNYSDTESFCHRALTFWKRSALLKHHLKFLCSPHWLDCFS